MARKRQQDADTHGMVVTAPEVVDDTDRSAAEAAAATEVAVEAPAEEATPEVEVAEPEITYPDVQPADETPTVKKILVAVGRLYNLSGAIAANLNPLLRTTADDPELHAFLSRTQLIMGEFRHSVDQLEAGLSDRMRDAIHEALAE